MLGERRFSFGSYTGTFWKQTGNAITTMKVRGEERREYYYTVSLRDESETA